MDYIHVLAQVLEVAIPLLGIIEKVKSSRKPKREKKQEPP